MGRKVRSSWREWSVRRVKVFGAEGETLEELEPEKPFLPEPDCYGRKSSAPNSPQRGSSNVRPTMRVQARTARESRRHHRGLRRRPAGGELNEARREALRSELDGNPVDRRAVWSWHRLHPSPTTMWYAEFRVKPVVPL